MELHLFSGSGYAWRVQLVLEFKQQPYELVQVAPSPAGLKSPSFLALNPRGKVPVLRDGETVLAESLAILAYLERRFPEPPLFGTTPNEVGSIWQAVLDFDLYVAPTWVSEIIAPVLTGPAESHADGVRAARPGVDADVARLNAAVARGGYLAGTELSGADLAVLPFVEAMLRALGKPLMRELGVSSLELESTAPALAAWCGKLRALPIYAKAYPRFWSEVDEANPT